MIARAKITPWAILLFMWTLESGFLWAEWRPLTQSLPFESSAAIRYCAAISTLDFLVLCVLFYTQWSRIRAPLAFGLFWGGLAHTSWLLWTQAAPILGLNNYVTLGLLGNRSIGASFTAVWWFFALYCFIQDSTHAPILGTSKRFSRFALWTSWIALPAVFISVSSISFGALSLGVVAVLLALFPNVDRETKWILSFVAWGVIAVTLLLGAVVDPEWTHVMSINRIEAWTMFINYYVTHNLTFFGSGPGTFKFYGPMIQATQGWKYGDWWLWAHSDWIQVYLELGVIGLVLAMGTFFTVLKASFNRPLLFGAVASYGAIMLGNYPCHIAMTALLGFWLVFESLWGNKEA